VEKIKATKWMIPMLKSMMKPIMLNTIYKIKTKKIKLLDFSKFKISVFNGAYILLLSVLLFFFQIFFLI